MLASMLCLPKWLLAFVVLGVLTGSYQQVKCKVSGCDEPTVASVSGEADHDDAGSVPPSEDQHCQCQCHFVTLGFCELPAFHVHFVRAVGRFAPVWIENAPEAPCADIDHPPQLI